MEKEQERESEGEKENKLFMLTSNVPQRVVKRKRWASVLPVWAPADRKWASRRESLREEDELMHPGGRRKSPLPPLDFTWFMWQL